MGGDTRHDYTKKSYSPSWFHALAVERRTLKEVASCRILTANSLCSKLVDVG
jgi:hypothetical protein